MPITALDHAAVRAALVSLPDWRLQLDALATAYTGATAADALAFVAAVGAAAEDADHHPDVDWRHRRVFVRTTTHAADDRVTARDTALAARVSELAAAAGLLAEPALARCYEVAVDAADPGALLPVWAAALGYRARPERGDAVDPQRRGPAVWFQRTATPAPSRLHLDVTVADEAQVPTVDAAVGAGGAVVDARWSPAFVVVADPDGNRVCVCTPQGRGPDDGPYPEG